MVGDPGRAHARAHCPWAMADSAPVGILQGRLDVDERRRRQQQLDLGPSPEPVGPQAVAQLGQQHAEGVARLRRDVVSPAGRVVGGDLYYDQVSLLTQLGLLPQPSAA